MHIRLIASYLNEKIAWKAAAICVGKLEEATEKNMLAALSRGHLSIIEHLPLTFIIEDVPRSLTHQLVRHRHNSFSQLSQRYTKVNTNEYIIPEKLKDNKDVKSLLELTSSIYEKLLHDGIKKEDARSILPECSPTSIIVSTNARSFVEMCQKRLCIKAQQDIRNVFNEMKELIKDIYPNVYNLCKANCDNCKELNPCINNKKEI